MPKNGCGTRDHYAYHGSPANSDATTIILRSMSLGVRIAQIDTSVVNLAVKRIGADFNVGVNMLQWVVDA